MPISVTIGAAIMLLIGIAEMPYGYYTLLKLVSTGVFLIATWIAYDRKLALLPWIYLLFAIIFNPLVKIHFEKEVWAWIDLAASILLVSTLRKINPDMESKGEPSC
jgi:hypothetical protein